MKRIAFCLLIQCLWYNSSIAQSGQELIKVTDMLKIKSIANLDLTNDASRMVFTVTTIEPQAGNQWEYDYLTQIWMANTNGLSEPRQLTFAREGATLPAWSPDGKQLAFVRSIDGKSQIFILPLNGGEPYQLTKWKYGASSPVWSPDGRQILFTASLSLEELLTDSLMNPRKELPKWPTEKPGFPGNANLNLNTAPPDPDGNLQEVRSYLAVNEKDNRAKVIDQLSFQEESTTTSRISFSHIFIVDVSPGASPHPVTSGFHSFQNPRFIGNSGRILLETRTDDSEHPDRTEENELDIINKDGSGLRRLYSKREMVCFGAAVSPSGKWLAFQSFHSGTVGIAALYVMNLEATDPKALELTYDRSKSNLQWSSDDKFLYFTASSHGGFLICRSDISNRKTEPLSDVNSGISSYAVKKNLIAFVKTEVPNPFELYAADTQLKNSRRISTFNQDWLKQKKLSYPEKDSFINKDGMAIEYWIMKPVDFQPGKKYPLLLEIHGGPAAMWGPGEATMWHEFQFFCSRGYGIVYCNPRGSGGYGQDFLRANIDDWGAGPASDVLTALDRTISLGWSDTSKLLITGGSYAGYLVAWIIAHDHRFKAACSQRGVYDLSTFFGEGNAWRLVPEYFGGYPWEPAANSNLVRESPITYVQNISTPYIIFHGENDLRTGTTQSEMLYKSLKVLQRPVEYVRHPGATHEITRSGNNRQRIDQMLRTWEFFERWIH